MSLRHTMALPALCIGAVLGVAGATMCKPHVVFARSAYSGESFLLAFAHEPSESELLDAVIQRDSLIEGKIEAKRQRWQARSDGQRLKGADYSLLCEPFSADQDPDLVFEDGSRFKGVWLTEPSTRVHFQPLIIRCVFLAGGLLFGLAISLVARWLWYFSLARVCEVSAAIRSGSA